MGSLSRKLKREQQKKQYEGFTKEWREEKAKRIEASKKGEQVQLLGRRPPLKYYTQAMSEQARKIEAAIREAVSKEKIAAEVKDLDWEEEDKPKEN